MRYIIFTYFIYFLSIYYIKIDSKRSAEAEKAAQAEDANPNDGKKMKMVAGLLKKAFLSRHVRLLRI